jgi:predicted nucleic acid-binding protein
MGDARPLRVVFDTNIVFEGLSKQQGACGLCIDAWFAGLMDVRVSDALVYEYAAVLSHKLSSSRWERIGIALATLLNEATFTAIYFTWRPSSPDPGDDFVVDCAMNANAILVTLNLRDFRRAERELGLQVITPLELLKQLANRRV